MEWLDFVIAAAYVAAFMKTHKKEYVYCFFAHLFCLCFFWTVGEIFSEKNGGIECLYFLSLSGIWIFAISLMKLKTKACLTMLIMATYELLCGIESFIWQFFLPVTTPVIEYYIGNVVAIHVIIMISIHKWGVRIEKPMERIFINGKRFNFGLLGHKIMARNIEEVKR
jgi:hypothetical protein